MRESNVSDGVWQDCVRMADVPLWLELCKDFPLRVVAHAADRDEASEVLHFGPELDAGHCAGVRSRWVNFRFQGVRSGEAVSSL